MKRKKYIKINRIKQADEQIIFGKTQLTNQMETFDSTAGHN